MVFLKKKMAMFGENSLVMPIFAFFWFSGISGTCDMVVDMVGLVWIEIEAVVSISGSV